MPARHMIRHATTLMAALAMLMPFGARALDRIETVETGSASSTRWPAYIAADTGIFAAHGLEVVFVPAPASSGVMQQVAAASVPMGAGSPVDALRAIDKGAPITMLRIESSEAPYEVFAKPSIRSLGELRGKTIMIGGLKDITRFYVERMLTTAGVKYGDFDYVFAGATAQRYAALQSGSIDATILAAPFNFRARKDGFTNLGATPDFTPGIPFSAIVVNVPWGREHKDLVARLLAAYEEGVQRFYDPAHRDEAIDILQRRSRQDRADVEQTYDFFVKLQAIDRNGAINQNTLGEVIRLLQDQGDLSGPPEAARFYDTSLGAKVK